MPNLAFDPQNPSDLLGQPLAVGDIVAWGTTYGRSPALCIAKIEKLRFVKERPLGDYRSGKVECPRDDSTGFTLSLRPIVSTGDITWVWKDTGKVWYDFRDGPRNPDEVEAKLKTVFHVKNVVKLSPDVIV